MIRSLTLHNFQNHEFSQFDFAPGINVIVGPSDSGKSAVIRAFEWVRTNRPLGTSFVRHGADRKESCEVEVVCVKDKGSHKLRRTRGVRGGVNEYRLGNNAMKAVGSDVPQEVADCLNMEDLNVQRQLSPHFLVLDSPGMVGKAINAAVHMEKMDECVSEASSRVRGLNGAIANNAETIKKLEDELAEFEDLSLVADNLADAVDAYKAVKELTGEHDKLSQAVASLVNVQDQIDAVPDSESVKATLAQIEVVSGVEARCENLGIWIDGYIDVASELRSEGKRAKLTQGALLVAMKDEACTTCGRAFDEEAKLFILGEV